MPQTPEKDPNKQYVDDPEWENWNKYGFESDYVQMSGGPDIITISPAFGSAEGILKSGFYPKGTKVTWNDHHGSDYERDRLRRIIDKGHTLTVKSCRIGTSSSTYEFEEIEGGWNTVMFDKVES